MAKNDEEDVYRLHDIKIKDNNPFNVPGFKEAADLTLLDVPIPKFIKEIIDKKKKNEK